MRGERLNDLKMLHKLHTFKLIKRATIKTKSIILTEEKALTHNFFSEILPARFQVLYVMYNKPKFCLSNLY